MARFTENLGLFKVLVRKMHYRGLTRNSALPFTLPSQTNLLITKRRLFALHA